MDKVGVKTTLATESISFKGKTQEEIKQLNEKARLENEARGIFEVFENEEVEVKEEEK